MGKKNIRERAEGTNKATQNYSEMQGIPLKKTKIVLEKHGIIRDVLKNAYT